MSLHLRLNRKRLEYILTKNASLFALLSISIVLGIINKDFFTLSNLFNILDLGALVSITTIAMALILLMGSIDLSVEGIVGLSGVVVSFLVKNLINSNNYGLLSIPIALMVGAAFGFLNGYLFSTFKIPSFMTTLGVGFIASGIGVLITRGSPIVITDMNFRRLGVDNIGFMPNVFLFTLVIFIILFFIQRNSILGKHIMGIGGDESIVKDLGINTKKVKIIVFSIAGALYGLTGSLLTAKLGSGDVTAPLGYTFDSIGACLLGGIAITGGVGNIPKALIGAFILTILRNGMILMGVSPYIQQGIIGILIIATVTITIDRSKIEEMK